MAKIRIYELAKDLDVKPKELVDMLETIGVDGKVPSSSIEETAAQALRQMIHNKKNPVAAPPPPVAPPPAAPSAFKNFRTGDYKPPVAQAEEEVVEDSAEVIEDFREAAIAEQAAAAETARIAASGPGRPPQAPPTPTPAAPPTNGAAPAASAAPVPPPPARPPVYSGRGRNYRGGGGGGARRGRRGDREAYAGEARFGDRDYKPATEEESTDSGEKKIVLGPSITVSELAAKVGQPPAALIKRLFSMSIIRSANQPIETDVASHLAGQFGYTIEVEKPRTESHFEEEDVDALVSVPPVVTVMGHVDHGKTSLLDIIRSANIQSGEAGGITQRIGAYETEHNGERLVFLDTPGHAAFTRMRARGAHVTDIAVLVVAADDGVMPQTREAIDHARAAKVPIIVAMNKIDRAEADPDRVKGQLAEVGLIPEDYGGDVVTIPVSAKTGQGVQELLDMLLLVAELQELRANPNGFAQGTVIEARQDTQKGPVATVLVHRGTLRVGDHVVVGDVHGRIRAMTDYKGDELTEAGPKTPVFIMGLSAVPHASDSLTAVGSSREAREQAQHFAEESKQGRFVGAGRVSLEELFSQIQKGGIKELNVVVKADGQGSVEALCQSLEKLAHDEVRVRIISRGVGNVTESDVMLASASGAVIISFAVGAEPAAASLADREKIEIRNYKVIYDAIDEIKAGLEGMLEPVYQERLSGEAEVRDLFKSTRTGTIAGCLVVTGKFISGSILRVLRGTAPGAPKKQIFQGRVDSLRHVKADVKEMVAGQECGIACKNYDDFQIGDMLQSVVRDEIKRTLDSDVRRTSSNSSKMG